MREYNYYVLGYLIISSIISFAICYRFGPVNNSKTVHLLQWGLQVYNLLPGITEFNNLIEYLLIDSLSDCALFL